MRTDWFPKLTIERSGVDQEGMMTGDFTVERFDVVENPVAAPVCGGLQALPSNRPAGVVGFMECVGNEFDMLEVETLGPMPTPDSSLCDAQDPRGVRAQDPTLFMATDQPDAHARDRSDLRLHARERAVFRTVSVALRARRFCGCFWFFWSDHGESSRQCKPRSSRIHLHGQLHRPTGGPSLRD